MRSTGVIAPLFFFPMRHLYHSFSSAHYRDYHRLSSKWAKMPRFQKAKIHSSVIGDWQVPDVTSFLSAYKGIFVDQIYRFKSNNSAPRILDCGANIGLSVYYFKKLFPQAFVTAFEADPTISAYLQSNLKSHQLEDVEVVTKAVWKEGGELIFHAQGGDVGSIVSGAKGTEIKVPAVRLQTYLEETVDFLKLDIEGAEIEVALDCGDNLSSVNMAFVEYHSFASHPQRLSSLIDCFEKRGFRSLIYNSVQVKHPLWETETIDGEIDSVLNLFFWKKP